MKGKEEEEEKEGLERLKRKKRCCRRLLACGQNSLERERDYTESVTECAPLSTTPRQTIYVYCTTTRHRLLVFFSPLLCSLLLLFGSRLFFFFLSFASSPPPLFLLLLLLVGRPTRRGRGTGWRRIPRDYFFFLLSFFSSLLETRRA